VSRFQSRKDYERWKDLPEKAPPEKSIKSSESSLKWLIIILLLIFTASSIGFLMKKRNDNRLNEIITGTIDSVKNERLLTNPTEIPLFREKKPNQTPTMIPVDGEKAISEDDGVWGFLEFDDKHPEKEESGQDNKIDDPSVNDYDTVREKKLVEYFDNVNQITNILELSGKRCELICSKYIEIYTASYKKYNRGFAKAISNQKQKFEEDETFQLLREEKQKLKEMMIKLEFPQTEFVGIYNIIKDFHRVYEGFYAISINPPQSMDEFEKRKLALNEKFRGVRNQVELYFRQNDRALPF